VIHNASTYAYRRCRCDVCKAAHRERVGTRRDQRRAERVLVDGRMVAVRAARHGNQSTYSNWFCRCRPCTDAVAAYFRERRR